MQTFIVALVVALALVGWFAIRGRAQSKADPEEDAAFADVQRAGIAMSREAFHNIREENRKDKEQFGDGTHAPHWPKERLNGDFTLRRGVWVDDSVSAPSNRTLDAFREKHKQTRRVVKFTLVEGEQMAPFGKNHAMVKVRATAGRPGEHRDKDDVLVGYIPMVSVHPVEPSDSFWGMTFMGTLPAAMSYTAEEGATSDAVDPHADSTGKPTTRV
jgi:hypothetical protein